MFHVWKSWGNRYRVNLSEEKGLLQMWDEDQAMYGEYYMERSMHSCYTQSKTHKDKTKVSGRFALVPAGNMLKARIEGILWQQ